MVALAVIALLTGELAFYVGMIIWIYRAVGHRGRLWIGWGTLLGGITLFVLGSVGIAVFYEPRSDRAAETPPEMILIPAGRFLMGSTEDSELADDDEYPQHEVELDAFRIGRYPVTNAQYARFIEVGGYENPAFWTEASWAWRDEWDLTQPAFWEDPRRNQPDHPVVGVSWYEALAYCRWLSEASGQAFRLPTEAEWEKAARGEDAREWPWGNEFDPQKANTSESGPGTMTPVGKYSPVGDSPYGASDMAGNVWEWCQDWYAEDYYRRSPSGNPPGPTEGDYRVLRGGSWSGRQRFARCASRRRLVPDGRVNFVGFRVVVSPGSP